MDYPRSVASSQLYPNQATGKFTDGNPSTGIPPSNDTAEWADAITDEVINVQTAGGQAAAEGNNAQLLAAILELIQSRSGNYTLDTGVANAYVTALNPPLAAWANGVSGRTKINDTNTGASTFNAGPGAVALVDEDGNALGNGELPGGMIISWVYDAPSNKVYVTNVSPSSVTQSGAITAGHIAKWIANGQVGDGGVLGALANYGVGEGLNVSGSNLGLRILAGGADNGTAYALQTADDGIIQYHSGANAAFTLPNAPRIGYIAAFESTGYQISIACQGTDILQFGNSAGPTNVSFTVSGYELLILTYRGAAWVPLQMTPAIALALGLVVAALTKKYTSPQQTITTLGALTLAHGLGATPGIMRAYLVCQTADFNYVPGNVLEVALSAYVDSSGYLRGVDVMTDATNIYIFFGSDGGSSSFLVGNWASNVPNGLTNSHWKFVIQAYT